MKLTKEEACNIICDFENDWETVSTSVDSNSRWSIHKSGVFKHLPTNKFYRLKWSEGATEYQDERPFEYSDPDPIEVRPVEKTIIVYEQVT
jgi:hypothetical protein